MRELSISEVNLVNGAIAPVLFVGAVVISRVSAVAIARNTGAMIGGGIYYLQK